MPWSSRLRSQAKSPFLIWKAQDDLTGTLIMRRDSSHNPDLPSTTIVHEMNDDVQPLEPRISGEFLVRRKRKRPGVATDPGLGYYVPSSPTSVEANPSSETAEPRSVSSENHEITHNQSKFHPPMEVDDQAPPGTPPEFTGSRTPTPTLTVEGFLRKSARGSRKRQKLKHVDLSNTPRDASPTSYHPEERSPPRITQSLTSTVPRRKRRTRPSSSRVKTVLVKGKAYRTRSQKPKKITDDLVRAALLTHVDVDDEFLEDGRKPQCRLDMGPISGLTQNTPVTVRRRNLVHPSKTQPFPREPSLGSAPVDPELGRHPRKPMTAWEGALALSKLGIQMPTSTVTPRRKGRPIQGSSARIRGRYPKLPLTPLSPTPIPTSRGHPVPRSRLRLQRGLPGQQTHPEVTAIPIISAEEITSPNSEPGSEHEFGSGTLNPAIYASNHDLPAPSYTGRARASGVTVTNPSRSESQKNFHSRKVRFSPPLAPDPEDDKPDDQPEVLVPNSSDPNLSRHVSPDPSNHVSQSFSSPPPFPPPHLLFVQSRPLSIERTLGDRVPPVESDVEREPREGDALVPPITVSTRSKTTDDNGEVVPGGLGSSDGKKPNGREETENVDQHQFGANSPFGSQRPSEPLRGNVQDRIERHGVQPHIITSVWDPDMQQGEGARRSPAASQPAESADRVEDSKPLESHSYHLAGNVRRVESGVRSILQAEVEGDEGDEEAIETSKEVTASSGPPHPAPFPQLGRILSTLGESGPSRSVDGFGRVITRRPRRPNGANKFRKLFQTQPPVEVESGWKSAGTSNVDIRPGAGASKSDDLSFFAGL